MRRRIAPIVLLTALAGACGSGDDPGAGKAESPSEATAPAAPSAKASDTDGPASTTSETVRAIPALPISPAAQQPAEPGSAAAPVDPRAERLAAIESEYDAARNAFFAAYRAAFEGKDNPTLEDLQAFQAANPEPELAPYVARAKALLDEDATDVTALRAIPVADRELAVARHDRAVGRGARAAPRAATGARRALRPLGAPGRVGVRRTPARGVAACRRARSRLHGARRRPEAGHRARSQPRRGERRRPRGLDELPRRRTRRCVAKARARRARTQDREALRARRRRVRRRQGRRGAPSARRRSGARAGAELFETRNLAVGKPAPEIEGQDLDGVAFKLSDYRGKVVLLDFWGHW
jgi:hypothetical protein